VSFHLPRDATPNAWKKKGDGTVGHRPSILREIDRRE
jgi:hypothetical protein